MFFPKNSFYDHRCAFNTRRAFSSSVESGAGGVGSGPGSGNGLGGRLKSKSYQFEGPASSRATLGIEEFTAIPCISVLEKGFNKTRISKESSVHEDELDGLEEAGKGGIGEVGTWLEGLSGFSRISS
ncbi:hypothetical protein SO802_018734 [Lithocarpus litseifolius]|uniref:Uncharacterized protein n=1 Tax=Lithocarpus litseifolius TaxID=425828 RepID=A0AAW2CN66_9ROSI